MAHQDIQENQDIQSSDTQVEKNLKYYTASQWQLVWWRFRRHRMAMFGGCVLLIMVVMGAFPGFFGPYNGTTRDADYVLGPPQMMKFWDANGASFRPFIHGITTSRDPVTLRKIATTDPDVRHYVHFFVAGEEYSVLGLFKSKLRLFSLNGAKIHLFGTDDLGRDLYSRTLIGTGTSISIGVIGVILSFILALIIGGIAGYFGGLIDQFIQRTTEIVRVVPVIPLFMGLAAAFPKDWSNIQVYFAITIVLGLIGWPTLARRIRGHLLSQKNEDYVLAAKLAGAKPARIISKHLLPSFTGYIIVDLVITFPYAILSETALSFIGLCLRAPSVSWGILLQDAQNIRAIEQAPWLFIPALFVIVAVLAFTFLGDGLRDAADPYTVSEG